MIINQDKIKESLIPNLRNLCFTILKYSLDTFWEFMFYENKSVLGLTHKTSSSDPYHVRI